MKCKYIHYNKKSVVKEFILTSCTRTEFLIMMFLVSLVFPDSSKRPLEKKTFIKSKDLQTCKLAEPSISVVPCSREEKKRTLKCKSLKQKHIYGHRFSCFINILTLRIYEIECCSQYIRVDKKTTQRIQKKRKDE